MRILCSNFEVFEGRLRWTKQHSLDNHNLTITRDDLVNNTKILCDESDHNKLSIIEALSDPKNAPIYQQPEHRHQQNSQTFHIACPSFPTRFSTFCTYYFITFPLTSLTVPCKKKLYWYQYCCSYYYILFSLTLIIPAIPMLTSFFSDTDHFCCSYVYIIFFFSLKLTVLEKNFFVPLLYLGSLHKL